MGRPPLPPELRKPRLSGSGYKKKRIEKHSSDVKEVRKRAKDVGIPLPGDDEAERCTAEFAALLEEYPAGSSGFIAAAHELGTRQMLRSSRVSPEDKWKLLDKMTGTHGLMQNRAELEQLAGRLEELMAGVKDKGAVNVQDVNAIPRSKTARGGSSARRPGPVS